MEPNYIYLTHVLFSAPVFIFLGHNPEIKKDWISYSVIGLGLVVVLYHLFKLYSAWNLGYINWVNVIHGLVIGPLLIFAGWKRNLPYPWSQIFLVLGYGAMVNFLIKLISTYHNV